MNEGILPLRVTRKPFDLYPNTNYKQRFVIQPAICYRFKDLA